MLVTLLVLAMVPVQSQNLETVIQQGHELAVVTVAVSTDSNFVITGSRDKSAKLWDINTGREVRNFLGHDATVTSAVFTPDGRQLITASNDMTVRLWQVNNGNAVLVKRFGSPLTDVEIDPLGRFFAVGGRSDTVTVFDLPTLTVISTLAVNPELGSGTGVDLAISADGNWLAIGEDNRTFKLFRTSDWSLITSTTMSDGSCGGCGTRVVFTPDSKTVYAATEDGPLAHYDLSTSEKLTTLANDLDDLTGLAISADGRTLAYTTEKNATIYDLGGSDSTSIIAREKGQFNELAFSRDGTELLIACDDNTAIRWDIAEKKVRRPYTGLLNDRDRGGLDYDPNFYWQSAIAKYIRFKNNILISRDGKSLIKGKLGTRVKQWDIGTGKVVTEFVGHKKAVLCYALSTDGKHLLTGGGDGKIILWDVERGDSLLVINAYREPIFDIHFSHNESAVISSSWDGSLRVHNLTSGKMVKYVEFQQGSAYSIRATSDDLYFVTARLDNSLQLWEMDTHKEVRNFIGHTDIISSISFSKDQRTLLSTSWDGTTRLWDVGTGLMTRKFKVSSAPMHVALFSEHERNVYAAGADRVIRTWDIQTSKVVREFPGHKAEITSLVISPDRKMLISHSVDGVTKFWDLTTGREFFEHILIGQHDWMAKTPDGYFSGTDEARRHIHFVSGTKTFAVDQFFNEYFRPDLMPKLFNNRGTAPNTKGIQGKLKTSPPPTVKVAVVPTTPGKAEVYVRVLDNGSGVHNLKLFHNGKAVAIDPTHLRLPKERGQTATYKHNADLIGGNNMFSATAANRDNIESDPQSATFFSEHITRSSTCYILAVGINQYQNTKLSLNYARSDAESFASLMKDRSGKLYKNIQTVSIYDNQATRLRILATLEELSTRINQEDVFIFYYAGHGSMVDQRFYFVPTESSRLYDERALNKEAIEASILQEKFSHIKALKQLIIMDACQSGGSVELLATRGAGEEKAIAQLSRSAGIHVMASAGSEQFATEFASLGHGLFTAVLIRGLQGEADGAPKDGKVTIYELKSFIDDQVPEQSRKLKGNSQYPYTFSRGQDFPLVLDE